VSNARLIGLSGRELELPPFAPDVAIEVLSPDDVLQHVAHKISVYLASGSELVIVVDPHDRSVRLHDRDGVRVLHGDDVLQHDALPGFALALPTLFRAIDPPR
jgi:Uma2 family endonuclease